MNCNNENLAQENEIVVKKICPECNTELFNNDKFCSNCGFNMSKAVGQNKNWKIVLLFIIIGVIGILFTSVTILLLTKTDEKKYAQKLIEKDLGVEIECMYVYYNEDKNMCFVEFINNGLRDIAMVNFSTKKVGYDSVMTEYANQANKYSSNYESDEYKNVASIIRNYTKLYDTVAFFAAERGDDSWKQIYP